MPKKKADLEAGYTRIANSIMQKLYTCPILDRKTRVLLFIIYQTYGYNHKERKLTNSYIGTALGIKENHVSEAVKKLAESKIINQSVSCRNKGQILSINKYLDEWCVTPKIRSIDTPKIGSPKSGSIDTPKSGSIDTPEIGKQYNTDIYNTDIYNTECVGAAQAPPRHTPIFDRLWSEWKYSQAGKERVTKKQREEIENNGYLRMADAAERYYRDFDSRTSLHNQPLSARTWFSGAYIQYLPSVDEATRIWYDVDGHKCRGERRYV